MRAALVSLNYCLQSRRCFQDKRRWSVNFGETIFSSLSFMWFWGRTSCLGAVRGFWKTSLDSNGIIFAVLFGAASGAEMTRSSFMCISLMAICIHTIAAAFAVSLRWMWTATSSDKRYADGRDTSSLSSVHHAALPITWFLHKPPAIKMCALFSSS